MKTSKLGLLNWLDAGKGIIVAVITAVLTALLQMLTLVPPSIDWKQIGIIAITSMISYLLKQMATNSKGQLFTSEIGPGTVGTSGGNHGGNNNGGGK